LYIAKKEVMNKLKGRNGFIGFMKNFMDLDTNNLKPDMDMTATSSDYFFEQFLKNEKKTRLMAGYKSRSGTRGRKRFILNIEELATLWHFPIEAVVKAPLIQKAPGRKSEPPMELPTLSEKEIDSRLFDDSISDSEDIFSEKEEINNIKKVENNVKKVSSDAGEVDDDSSLFDLEKEDEFKKEAIKTQSAPRAKITERAEVDKKGNPPSNLPFA
jgi:hypothetical protein